VGGFHCFRVRLIFHAKREGMTLAKTFLAPKTGGNAFSRFCVKKSHLKGQSVPFSLMSKRRQWESFFKERRTVAEGSKVPDRERRSEAVGAVPGRAVPFYRRGLQKNQTRSVGARVTADVWGGTLRKVLIAHLHMMNLRGTRLLL